MVVGWVIVGAEVGVVVDCTPFATFLKVCVYVLGLLRDTGLGERATGDITVGGFE